MEIPAWLFFSFWALISVTFLHLGFYALDKSHLSHSVSPVVMSLFKHSFAISCCHSSSYALIFRPLPSSLFPATGRYLWLLWGGVAILFYSATHATIALVLFSIWQFIRLLAWPFDFVPTFKKLDRFFPIVILAFFYGDFFPRLYFPVSTLINIFLIVYLGNDLRGRQKAGIGVHMAVESSLFLFTSSETSKFSAVLVLGVSFLTSAFWAWLSGLDSFTCISSDDPSWGAGRSRDLLAVAANKVKQIYNSNLKEKKRAKVIEFAVGAVATLLFQYFFKLTTFSQVAAFFYLAVAWTANLALLGVSWDLGVFNFLLLNVIVSCTESQFGLQGATWIAFGASLLLFGLRLKMESLTFVGREEQTYVVLW